MPSTPAVRQEPGSVVGSAVCCTERPQFAFAGRTPDEVYAGNRGEIGGVTQPRPTQPSCHSVPENGTTSMGCSQRSFWRELSPARRVLYQNLAPGNQGDRLNTAQHDTGYQCSCDRRRIRNRMAPRPGLGPGPTYSGRHQMQADENQKKGRKKQGTVCTNPQANYRHEFHVTATDYPARIEPK